ncbi:MAG: SpoIIE family protein phosphatase [Clostridiales bacterium]|nr:SpoIIE family protein phosphatase [Clostridiales bacterium]
MNYGKMSGTLSRLTEGTREFAETLASTYKKGCGESGNVVRGVYLTAKEIAGRAEPLLYALAGALLSSVSILGAAAPFGASFLASVSGERIILSSVYVGTVLGSLFTGNHILANLIICTLVFAFRLSSPFIFENPESLSLKMASSLAAALLSGVYIVVSEGIGIGSILSALLICALMPALAFLYSGAWEKESSSSSSFYREAGAAALAISLIMPFRGVTLFTLEMSLIIALTASLCFINRYGALKGIVFALAASFALSFGAEYDSALIPIFAICAVIYGLVRIFSPYFGVTLAAMSSISWALYTSDYLSALKIAPEIVTSCVLIAFGSAFGIITEKKRAASGEMPDSVSLLTERLRSESISGLLDAESEALSSLSDMLYRLSDRHTRPSAYDVREAASEARIKVCRHCSRLGRCMNEDASTASEAWDTMYRTLYKTGSLDEDMLPDFIASECKNGKLLAERMNAGFSALLRGLVEGDKFEVMADDYGAASEMLRETLLSKSADAEIDAALSKKLTDAFAEEKIKAERICIFGKRIKTAYIQNLRLTDLHVGEDDLRRLTSRVCGGAFSPPKFEIHGNGVCATLKSERAFAADCRSICKAKEDSSACGDSVISFECRDDRYAVILSDGMGSGRDAALTSGMCCMFVERLMSSGCSSSVTLRLLNSMLRARRTECSCTVDLCEIDLITGQAVFIKSGAAPSFIIRGGSIYKIASHTLPIGIIAAADAERTVIDTLPGDIIIMLSDGVTKGEEDPAWLYSMIEEIGEGDLAGITEMILRAAREHGAKNDDATVCAIRTSPSESSLFA